VLVGICVVLALMDFMFARPSPSSLPKYLQPDEHIHVDINDPLESSIPIGSCSLVDESEDGPTTFYHHGDYAPAPQQCYQDQIASEPLPALPPPPPAALLLTEYHQNGLMSPSTPVVVSTKQKARKFTSNIFDC
jgi:hypothetical protein